MANTPPAGTMFAIPNFTSTTNTFAPNLVEPGTVTAIASAQPRNEMNGTYLATGSHFYTGGWTVYGAHHCFEQNGRPPIDVNGFFYGPVWMSRSASNNYAANGSYIGSTSTVVSGNQVNGEYVSITSPYSFILSAYSIISANNNGPTTPAKSWTIAGSNNGGTTWTTVDVVTDSGLSLAGGAAANIEGVYTTTSTTLYSSYIIIITSNNTTVDSPTAANLGTWNLYTPAPTPPCFVAGTRVLTQNGYKAIETLMMKDMMVLSDGRIVDYDMKKIVVESTTTATAPYKIEAGAFGPNKPAAEICLSPHHKLQIRKGVWISPERAAMTNPKVKQYGVGEPVTYWHIACDDYLKDNLVCEGIVVESLATNKNYTGSSKVYTWSDRLGGFTRPNKALKQLAQ